MKFRSLKKTIMTSSNVIPSTTTDHFQISPPFYESYEECKKGEYVNKSSNPRYEKFTHTVFHAGDDEQFERYRDSTPLECNFTFDLPDSNVWRNFFPKQLAFPGYQNIQANTVINTFLYIFHKFKKGIFVRIKDGKLKVFLPFSKNSFENEWNHKIYLSDGSTDIRNIISLIQKSSELEGRKFNSKYVNTDVGKWYGNNGIFRYEYPLKEDDHNTLNFKDMLIELCAARKIPDMEFFLNRRDNPLLTMDGTEPYNNIWGSKNVPLVSHAYEKYAPIFSMSGGTRYADLLFPTWDDWSRVCYPVKWFPKCNNTYETCFDDIPWESKKELIVFRGASTGVGTTIEDNLRLKIVYLSLRYPKLIDARITKWNSRVRKAEGSCLKTLNPEEVKMLRNNEDEKANFLTLREQAKFKYIITLDGHVSAFRLSLELGSGSVILLPESEWKLWFSDKLIPYVHYVPVAKDLSDVLNVLTWCKEHDEECKKIAKNAREFYEKFLSKDGILDYLQVLLTETKKVNGFYTYTKIHPRDHQISYEREFLEKETKERTQLSLSFTKEFTTLRNFYFLKGVKRVIDMLDPSDVGYLMNESKSVFENKLSVIKVAKLAGAEGDDGGNEGGCEGGCEEEEDNSYKVILKYTDDEAKRKEHIHEAFLGVVCLNELLTEVPNFSFIFGYKNQDPQRSILISEYVRGKTLFEYLKDSSVYSFNEFLFILIQISLALHVAQKRCWFVHNDLTPWNVVLLPTELAKFSSGGGSRRAGVQLPTELARRSRRAGVQLPTEGVQLPTEGGLESSKEYDVSSYKIKTNLIPVMIDFGKSHVLHPEDFTHHGFVSAWKTSTIHDIVSLLITSLNVLVSSSFLKPSESRDVLLLANFLVSPQGVASSYRKEPFTSIFELKKFLNSRKNYVDLCYREKHDLESKGPLDFISYIEEKFAFTHPGFSKSKEEESNFIPFNLEEESDSKLFFNLVNSETEKDRVDAYKKFFEKLLKMEKKDVISKSDVWSLYLDAKELEKLIQDVSSRMKREGINDKELAATPDSVGRELILLSKKSLAHLYGLYDEELKKIKGKDIRSENMIEYQKLFGVGSKKLKESSSLDPTIFYDSNKVKKIIGELEETFTPEILKLAKELLAERELIEKIIRLNGNKNISDSRWKLPASIIKKLKKSVFIGDSKSERMILNLKVEISLLQTLKIHGERIYKVEKESIV